MKRIEAIVHSERIPELNEELKKIGLSGCTIYDGKGRGKGEKPVVQSGRGTGKFTSEFDKVVKAILDTVSTGSPGDGKIFISTVADAIDIGTQKRGNGALK